MKKLVRLTETDLVRIVKRVLNEQNIGDAKLASNIKSQNDDRELLKKACEVYNGISSPEAKQKIRNWTKKYTGTQYPYEMTEACRNQAHISVTSENDRKILRGIINYDWM